MPFSLNRRFKKTDISTYGRLLHRNGLVNVKYNNFTKERTRSNLFVLTSLSSWTYLALIYAATFLASWVLFALMYYVLGGVHHFLKSKDNSSVKDATDVCVEHINDFLSILLFSIETQHTIGYGHRRPTTKCLTTIIILIIQSISALFIQNITAQAVYMKFSKPQLTVLHTPAFEQKCFIIRGRANMYLCINIVHHERFEIINSKVRLFCYKQRITKEGEIIPYECYTLETMKKSANLPLFLPIQLSVIHMVDKQSPLCEELSNYVNLNYIGNFEIVAILDGIYRTTGYPCHYRISYTCEDIKICTIDRTSEVCVGYNGVEVSLQCRSRGCTNDLNSLLADDEHEIVENIETFVGSQIPELKDESGGIGKLDY